METRLQKLKLHPFFSFLIREGVLTEAEGLTLSLDMGKKSFLCDVCVEMGFVPEAVYLKKRSAYEGLALAALDKVKIDKTLIGVLTMEFCKKWALLPLSLKNDTLLLACADPGHMGARDALHQLFPEYRLSFVLASKKAILRILYRASISHFSAASFLADLDREVNLAGPGTAYKTTIAFWDAIFQEGVLGDFSDLHITPRGNYVAFEKRIDGVLKAWFVCHQKLWPPLLSRLKVLSEMDITISNMPQQGRMLSDAAGEKIDIRCSTHPTFQGERVVLRFLKNRSFSLQAIGFSQEQIETIEEMLRQPQGLIAAIGPTGSGKTTTLHACLSSYVRRGLACVSLEEPVEYRLLGVAQTEIGGPSHFSYASGIESALRQDIDALLVGEVRSEEAAKMTLRAVTTGHPVLTTIHAKDVVGALDRLHNLGVSSALLTENFCGVIAQRLVRKLCRKCCKPSADGRSLQATGCADCGYTGYKGRTVIAHVATSNCLQSLAKKHFSGVSVKNDACSLLQSAAQKVLDGVTSSAEIARVLGAVPDNWLDAPSMEQAA